MLNKQKMSDPSPMMGPRLSAHARDKPFHSKGSSRCGPWGVADGALLPGEMRGRGLGAPRPLEWGAHCAKSSGPTWCCKCTASHLALHFSSFLQVHLEHIRKGSDWFGKCLGNSGHGRWSWKPVAKNMTPRQSSQLRLESRSPTCLPAQDKLPVTPSHALPRGASGSTFIPQGPPCRLAVVRRHPSMGPSLSPHVFLLLLLPTQTTNSAQALLRE